MKVKMDWDKKREKNTLPLIRELKDKCKKIHHLRKVLKIRTKIREEKTKNSQRRLSFNSKMSYVYKN